MPTVPDPPSDLSAESAELWPGLAADVAVVKEGAEVDFWLLGELLRTWDRLCEVREALAEAEEGVTVTGSQGQVRPHPLLTVERALAKDIAQGLERLELIKRSWSVEVDRAGRLRKMSDEDW